MVTKLKAKKLKTRDVLGVEILDEGDWLPAAGGPWTVDGETIDRIVANFAALGDLLSPPIKLGHDDEQALLQSDGYPAAGWLDNVRKKGTKIVCDFRKMPEKIADLVEAGGYRKCSVEVWKSFTVDGETYNDVLTSVSLLGNELPAVSTLDDIVALYASKAKIGFDANSQVRLALYPGPRRKAELGTDTSVEDRREAIDSALRKKYGDGISGYGWPWIEETFDAYVVVTRDGRHWKVPFSIGSDGSVALGSETEVEQTWRPITPAGSTGEIEEEGMADLKRIAAALGLADGATEDQIVEAATKTKAAATTRKLATQAECEEKGGKWNEETSSCEMPEPAADAPATDAKLASRVVELERTLAHRDAEDKVDAATRAMKVAPAQKEWALAYAEKDPEGFKAYVEKTPAIFKAGRGSESDADPEEDDVKKFQANVDEIRKADPKLDLASAQRQASRENPELVRAAYGR